MQSEFTCHIGLGGKYFCRVCYVCNPSIEDEGVIVQQNESNDTVPPSLPNGVDSEGSELDVNSEGGETENENSQATHSNQVPQASSGKNKGKGKQQKRRPKKKQPETLAQLVHRAEDFLTVRIPQLYSS